MGLYLAHVLLISIMFLFARWSNIHAWVRRVPQQHAYSSSARMAAPLLISIEGNIGAGKSTLLDALRKTNQDWVFIDEPVGEWSKLKNECGESMLEVFYKDRRRWSYTFQNCALLTRFQNIEAAVSKHGGSSMVFVTERCLDTDFHVFTKMLRADGSIDQLEYDLYVRWFNELKRTATPLSAIVHVDTAPEVCAERIVKRGRYGEEAIPLDYLRSLDTYQRAWVDAGDVPCIRASVVDSSAVERFVNKLVNESHAKTLLV